MTTTFNDYSGFATSGLMKTVCFSYSLRLDGWEVHLEKCSGQRIALGDYGDYSGGTLTCSGNLFEDMRTLGINPEGTAYCPVVSRVFGFERKRHCMKNEGDLAVAQGTASTYLALHQPKGISLPATEDFALLLKALSTRLAGMHLVTTIIQCSDFYEIDEDGKRKDPGGEQWYPPNRSRDSDSTVLHLEPTSLENGNASCTEKEAIIKYSRALLRAREYASAQGNWTMSQVCK